MITTGAQLFSVILFVLVNLLNDVLTAKNLEVFLTDVKCKHNPKYASSSSCELSGPAPALGVNFDMQMKNQPRVKDYRFDLSLYLDRGKKLLPLFKAAEIDICTEFMKETSAIYVEMFKEMTARAGKWPDCPVPGNFLYKFMNISPNIDYIPSFLPEVSFRLLISLKDRKDPFIDLTILGKTIQSGKSQKTKRRHLLNK